MRPARGVASLALLPALLASAQAAAQDVPSGAITPTREQVEQRPPESTVPLPASLKVEGDVERAPCALDRPEYQNIRFTPTEVTFEDLRGLSAEALRPAYAEYVGQDQPVSVVCEIRDRAATILRDAGYIASVEVPEQKIADGKLRFKVLMAKLVGVRVRGDAGGAEKKIASYLQRLTQDEVFNRYRAERYLLLARDIPGYSVRLALRSAGGAPGEVIGEVTVLHTSLIVDANIQNFGSRALGRWGGMVRGQFFGLTGMGDRTTVSVYSTFDVDEQQTVQLGHDFKLGNNGLTIAGNFTYAWTHPDLGDPAIDIKGKTLFATLEANYPFLRTQATSVRGAIGMDLINQDVDFNGLDLSRDQLRVAFLRFTADMTDTGAGGRAFNAAEPQWRLGGSVELRKGLDVLGATDDCLDDLPSCLAVGNIPPSRIDGNPTATVLRGTAYGEFRPMRRFTVAVGARGQYAKSPLFSFEEFSAGNYTIGRGYGAGTLLGDSGVGLQGELRFGSTVPRSTKSLSAEPFAFVDQAWAWNENRIGPHIPRGELTSVGGGVRASLGDQFRIEATMAVPLDRVGTEDKKPDPRFLLSVTTRLLPWSFR